MGDAAEALTQFDISKEETDKLVAEVIRFILFKSQQNSGCPIKREELTQIVTKNYRQRNLATCVINEAKNKLSSIFGYDLKELQRSRPSSTGQARPSQPQSAVDMKSYVLVSQLPVEVFRKYVQDENTAHMTGFTFVVLAIVHLAGGKIPEETLWHHLRRLGPHESEEHNPVFGDNKQALETLVQQRFLQKDKVSGPEGTTLCYELAERALDTQVKEKIKDYISQVMNKDVASVEID
ncbi:PREDICTED: non-structural maintenance of chromosomes element 3 homolog [Tarenaya hassleriana]|uniref:non-structural maintenance of chromosomes element 3 homolog n=1 Tax=Tarenaya hassleriana TaxID=28532 RepID=UPI00053C65A8|nr:PREDICTED: non-structural maintenance of chromosomes element 3 homolog [Tarenaya hassleriana]